MVVDVLIAGLGALKEYIALTVYDRILHAQQGRLKSHPDTGGDPVEGFKNSA